jgi:hypothetical protein
MAGFSDLLLGALQTIEDGGKVDPLTKEQLRQYALAVGDTSNLVKTWDRGDKIIRGSAIQFPESGFKIVRTTTQTIADSTDTHITFDTILFDDDKGIDLAVDATKVNIRYDGTYLLGAGVTWNNASTGPHYTNVELNDIQAVAQTKISGTESFPIDLPCSLINLSTGDYLKLNVRHNSGGTRDVIASTFGNMSVAMWGFRVRLFKERGG